jgi:hypothetical protein
VTGRQGYAHAAVLSLDDAGDPRALGAAVTVALCGHWEHEPPCPLAPHHSQATTVGGEVHLRIVFATEPERVAEVRERIDAALAAGELAGPDDVVTRWRLVSSAAVELTGDEPALAARLAA